MFTDVHNYRLLYGIFHITYHISPRGNMGQGLIWHVI